MVGVSVACVRRLAAGAGVRRHRGAARARRHLDPLRLAEGTRRRLTRSVAVATGLTVLVLLGFLFASSWYGPHQSRPVPGSLSVKLGARQWWWRIEYPGKTPSETVVTANELHLPAGRTVVLTLGSVDVVHSLWIPELSGKRDLIPGRVSDLVIRAERPGVYRGQCAEFCGAQHAHMGLLVFVEPPATFERWLAAQRAPARAPETELERHGARVFASASCPLCHAITGTTASSGNGPDLTHLGSRTSLAAATLPNTRAELSAWLRDPQAAKLGNHMPPNGFTKPDLDALLAYLEGLK